MPDMSSDAIRDISVRVVEGFFNDKVPLSVGLAKEASAADMNHEQIKRACEVTNTITHLKIIELSKDRTTEFPLCKTAEVMDAIVTPDLDKAATAKESETELVKEASYIPGFEVSVHEQTLQFIKEASVNAKTLDVMQDRAIILQSQLVKAASDLRSDKDWLRKLSNVQTFPYFQELSTLVSGSPKQATETYGFSLYKEAELKQAKSLVELYKEAKLLVAEVSKRRELQKRAGDLTQEMTKQAYFGQEAVGAVAGAVGKVGKTIMNTRPIKAFTGSVVGKTLGVVGATGLGVAKLATKGPVIAVSGDALMHKQNGGFGTTASGAPKDVWDALQN